MGRRGVQQLTPAQWREALEQQIREKQQQQEEAEQPQRRSQSAPHQDEAVPTLPGLERAATTASDGQAPGRRRRVQPQSREEYLRELQEQIEEKKRQAGQSKRRSRGDDEGGGGGESERLAESKSANTRADAKAPADLQQRLEDAKVDASSNQLEDDPCHPAVLQADVAADPGAITKIVDFCEELKRQNEDVKRQLLEQHAVLASLHSTLAVEADGKASGPILRRRSRGSVDKLRVNIEESDRRMSSNTGKAEVKDPEAKVTMLSKVVPRPRPMRGDTKIPFPGKRISSSLRLAGADIVKGVVLEHAAQPKSPLQRILGEPILY
ncbi:uncharacterized protein IUM83_06783 [Phytophthora cinnamomi]|uniref:uncharacterized protein n=1 Tax=Phytophthora cinnamomi TaxID=4785 RepID=UPI003559B542|nr:hypothetical protein IUM83_06783 [Phytophthora cinnamomi]